MDSAHMPRPRCKTLTYGALPTLEQFETAFYASWTCAQLWDAVTEIVTHWANDTGDEAGDYQDERIGLVSGILGTLGFEWV